MLVKSCERSYEKMSNDMQALFTVLPHGFQLERDIECGDICLSAVRCRCCLSSFVVVVVRPFVCLFKL